MFNTPLAGVKCYGVSLLLNPQLFISNSPPAGVKCHGVPFSPNPQLFMSDTTLVGVECHSVMLLFAACFTLCHLLWTLGQGWSLKLHSTVQIFTAGKHWSWVAVYFCTLGELWGGGLQWVCEKKRLGLHGATVCEQDDHLGGHPCYKYWLSDWYSDQSSHKNVTFYSQRHSEYYPLRTQLRTHYKHLMNASWANWTTGSKTEVHISSFRLCAPTLARWGNWTLTLSPRTIRIYSLHYETPSTWLHSAIATEMLPTIENCYMGHEGCPPDIKHPLYPLLACTSFLELLHPLYSLILKVATCTNR